MSNLRKERHARMKKGETPSEAYDSVGRSLLNRQGGRMPSAITMVDSYTPRRRSGQWGRRSSDNQAYPKMEGKEVLPTMALMPPQRRIVEDDGGEQGMENFKVMLIYEDDSVETIPIVAHDQDDALNHALGIRQTDPSLKVKTSLVHDGVGEIVSELVHGIEQGYTIGKKVVGRTARAGARVISDVGHLGAEVGAGIAVGTGRTVASYRRLGREYQIGRVEQLFLDMESTSPARRAMARRDLQRTFPEIYKHIGWTRV